MELYTRRSISECLGEAWTLLSTNLRRIIKSLWLPILLFSLAVGVFTPLTYNLEETMLTGSFNVGSFATIGAGWLCIMVAGTYLYAKIYKMLNEQTLGFCIIRFIKLAVVVLLIALVLTIIICAMAFSVVTAIQTGTVATIIGVFLALFAVLVSIMLFAGVYTPFYYVSTKYMIEPEMRLKDFWKAYKVGFKNFGKIFGLVILCALIVYFAQAIISMPGTIAIFAASFSLQGVANGDPNGLPALFALILGVTGFISTIVSSVLSIWNIFTQYYLYASIEAKEREKAQNESKE